jgi:hypothetical protein
VKKSLLLVMLCFLISSCSTSKPVKLDENTAIATTNAFLKAVMQGEYQSAYDQHMSPGIKFNPNSNLEHFIADWNAIVEKYGVLQKAVFDAYQIVPGKRVMQLYYLVTQEKVEVPIVYHFVLEQDKTGKFTIFILDIGNEKTYPENSNVRVEKRTKEEVIEVLPE